MNGQNNLYPVEEKKVEAPPTPPKAPAALTQHKHKKHSKFPHNPFIAERGMDEEVHGFVEDAINNPLGPIRNDEAYPLNGYKNVYADVDHSTSG